MNEMFQIKEDIEFSKDYYAKFGEKYNDYLQYAKEFAEKLKKDFTYTMNETETLMLSVDSENLPIVFHTDYRKDTDFKSDTLVTGDMKAIGNQSVINIYCCMDKEEEIKQRLRHELIHYCLYINETTCSDDSAIFHVLCQIYDAYAYEKMPDEEQIVYDKFVIAFDNLNALKEKQKLDDNSTAYRNMKLLLLFAVGYNPHNLVNEELLNTCTETLNRMSKERNVA